MSAPSTLTRHALGRLFPVGLACLVGLACNVTSLAPAAVATPVATSPAPASTATPPPATHELATPVAQEPAAGICASFEGQVAEFRIEPGIPNPRCAKVRADQLLKVVNGTDGAVDVMIGTYQAHLEPGDEYAIDTPFGDYLAPGVHLLQVLPCCGPEIVLEASPQ